jgi:hypothetical protein
MYFRTSPSRILLILFRRLQRWSLSPDVPISSSRRIAGQHSAQRQDADFAGSRHVYKQLIEYPRHVLPPSFMSMGLEVPNVSAFSCSGLMTFMPGPLKLASDRPMALNDLNYQDHHGTREQNVYKTA